MAFSVDELAVGFRPEDGVVRVSSTTSASRVDAGETLGIVGESGCGKSVTALSHPAPAPAAARARRGGRVLFDGRDLLELAGEEMRAVRGDRIGMIFQEPMTSLNPVVHGRRADRARRCTLHRG